MERQQSSSNEPTLVTLNSEYQAIAAEIVAAGGELTEESEKHLDEICAKLCEKVDGYGIVQEQLEFQAEFWKYQKQKCQQAERAFSSAAERLKARMKFVLGQHPEKALQGTLYRYALAKAADLIEIDETLLPDSFKDTEIKIFPNMERIKAALKEGKTIPGVTVKSNHSLRQGRPK